ncbi:MAG: hypothetical protein AABY15_03025 [Nanoarchaeota archaeon]
MDNLDKLHEEIKKLSNYNAIIAYGTGIYDGENAVYIYWIGDPWMLELDEVKERIPKEIAGYTAVNRHQSIHKIVLPKDGGKYVDERASYWEEDEEETEMPDRFAYPIFIGQEGLEVIKISYDGFGMTWNHPTGKYTNEKGEKYDWIERIEFYKTKISDGVAHDTREGWCFEVEGNEYPVPQTDIAFTMEEAKEEVKRRIHNKMMPLEKSLEYLKYLK